MEIGISSARAEFCFGASWDFIRGFTNASYFIIVHPRSRGRFVILKFAFCNLRSLRPRSAAIAGTAQTAMMPPYARGGGLALDSETAQLCSLSVELDPLRYADDVARLLKAMCRLPAGLPNRAELIAESLGGDYSRKALEALVSRLGRSGAELLEVSASLPQAGPTVYLIPRPLAKVERPGAPARVLRAHLPARVPPAAQRPRCALRGAQRR